MKKEGNTKPTFINKYFGFGFIGAFLVAALFTYLDTCDEKVVVTDKGDKKIAFNKLNSKRDTTTRIIQFENVANGMDYYNNIKVGDTLKLSGINDKLVYKNYVSFPRIRKSRIVKINGKTLGKVKEITERDIMMKQIHAANQKVR